MKVASWNVNSVKVRMPHILQWLDGDPVDVLALQETKAADKAFPHKEFDRRGYHSVFNGQPTYNGVALIGRRPHDEVEYTMPGVSADEKRVLAATYGDVRVVNWYVVNGQEAGSEKYAHKLRWLKAATAFIREQIARYPKLLVVGDFNIIPEDRDAHDPEYWRRTILATPPEREAFQTLLQAGLVDTFRLQRQPDEEYSWWPYWRRSFERNEGARIDFILATQPLASACTLSAVDKIPRAWERPSDHAPVVAEFRL